MQITPCTRVFIGFLLVHLMRYSTLEACPANGDIVARGTYFELFFSII